MNDTSTNAGCLPALGTHDGQFAQRVAELILGIGTDERLELLGVMDPDDVRSSLAFEEFDFALVRDSALLERLSARLDGEQDNDEDEPH